MEERVIKLEESLKHIERDITEIKESQKSLTDMVNKYLQSETSLKARLDTTDSMVFEIKDRLSSIEQKQEAMGFYPLVEKIVFIATGAAASSVLLAIIGLVVISK